MNANIEDVFKNLNKTKKKIEECSVDASIFRIIPKGVFVPKNREEVISTVREIISFKKENIGNEASSEVSITARSAGTCMSGGPLSHDYVMSFTEHINNILELDVRSRTVRVEPGMYYRDLEKETLKHGLILPSYPASRELCAMGGIVNNNSAGEKTYKYGKTDKYLKEVEMLAADGNVYNFKEHAGAELDDVLQNDMSFYGGLHRKIFKIIKENKSEIENNKPKVTKNSSGYALWSVYDEESHSMNLAKLICGAQGTLGLMLSSTLKLVEPEKESKMMVVFLKDIKDMSAVVGLVNEYRSESFEVFDDHTFKIAMRFLPQIVKRLGGDLLSLARLFWPEIKIVLTGNIPKIVMLIEFAEKSKAELDDKISNLDKDLHQLSNSKKTYGPVNYNIVKSEKEARKYWVFRRESFNLLRSKLKSVRTAPFIEDVVVKSSDLPDFLPRFEKILDEEKMVYTIAGHVGDGNIHVIPLMNLKDDKSIEQLERVSHKVYALVKEYGGSLSGEHNDGLIRAPFLNYMYTEKMLELFSEVKNVFDPLHVFNPKKKIGLSWDYAKKNIDRRK